jgi:tetratricopeptide (TPR) repeat protein
MFLIAAPSSEEVIMSNPVTLAEALIVSHADVRVLIAAPSPLNDPARLSPEPEIREVFEALDSVRASADVFRLYPATLSELRAAIAFGGFDVVHVATHGGAGALEFEKEDGTATSVPHRDFVDIFTSVEGCLLILNGCDTEGLGDLMVRTVPQLTAMSIAGDIPRTEAHTIVRTIFRSLFTGTTPEQAAANSVAEVQRAPSHITPDRFVRARGDRATEAIFRAVSVGSRRPTFYKCEPVTNMPRRTPVLFDRESEILWIYSVLFRVDSDTPTVGVSGITGTGKTALVRSFAGRYGWRFPDGIYYFSLDENFTAHAVTLPFGWSVDSVPPAVIASEVANRLAGKRCLLIFDDLDDGSPTAIRDLVTILSSWDTGLGGRAIVIAQTYRPEFEDIVGANWTTVGRLPVEAACELVKTCLGGAERARRALGNDLTDVVDLCFGHPRTIESTASLLRLGHPWADLRDDLEQLNEHGPISANSRVLGGVIARLERSHPVVQDLLDALSVFSGTCREVVWRRVTASVSAAGEAVDRSISDGLAELNFACLIERQDVNGESRCYLHPLVLGYLQSRHRGLSREKQINYVRSHLREQRRLVREVPDYASTEARNVRRVLYLAAEFQLWSETVAFCLAVVGARDQPMIKRGPWTLAREIVLVGVASARQLNDEAALLQLLISHGTVAYRLTLFDEATEAFDEAVTVAERAGARRALLQAVRAKGQVAYRVGDFRRAKEIYQDALGLTADLDALAVADIEHQLGKILYRQGNLEEARAVFTRVRASRANGGDQRELAKSVHELGRVEHAAGQVGLAQTLYEEALGLERASEDPVTEQATLFQLGRLAIEQGDVASARAYFEQSARISEKLSDFVWLAHAAFGRALVAGADAAHAKAHAQEALNASRLLKIGLSNEIEKWMLTAGFEIPSGE